MLNVARLERCGKQRAIEMRVAVRRRPATHVDEQLDCVRPLQLDQSIDGSCRVPDGVDGARRIAAHVRNFPTSLTDGCTSFQLMLSSRHVAFYSANTFLVRLFRLLGHLLSLLRSLSQRECRTGRHASGIDPGDLAVYRHAHSAVLG